MGNMDELDDLDKAKVAIAVAAALEHQARGWKRQAGTLNSGEAAPVTYSISGTVYDADGTTAVSGATVAIGASEATSAVDGTYSISGLAAGTEGSLTCTKSGYSWTAISVSAMSGDLTGQNFTNVWYAGGGSLASVVGAYTPIGAANLAASYVNLANPGTNNITKRDTNDPSFSAVTGWTFSGTDGTLKTGIVPAGVQARSMLVAFTQTDFAAIRVAAGAQGGNLYVQYHTASGGLRIWANGGTYQPALGSYQAGKFIIAAGDAYHNGSDVGNINTGTYTGGVEIYIGALNNAGTPSQRFIGSITAFAYWDVTLTPAQAAIISAACPS